MGGGNAEVDEVRTIIDVEERQRINRARRGGNGRVDAKVDAVKPPERQGTTGFARSTNVSGMKARVGVANTERTRERAPTVWLCWTKKQCEKTCRRAGLNNDAGNGNSMTKT